MAFWAVARTAPNRELLAYENVALRGYEIFVPRIRTQIGGQWKTASLFPCYLFVRVVDRWRAIERSPGVLSLIKFGDTPARCPDEEVGRLLERSDRDGSSGCRLGLTISPSASSKRALKSRSPTAAAGLRGDLCRNVRTGP